MYVCLCKGVTDKRIRRAILDGATNLKEVRLATEAMTQCGKCAQVTKQIVAETLAGIANGDEKLFYEVA